MNGEVTMSTEIALLKMCPSAAAYAHPIENACIEFGIDQAIYKAYFLATCATESMGFTVFEENLNYRAKGLRATFGARFTGAAADIYARKPREIANRAYANRLGNGNESSGDGWTYRGRGPIQYTGKANYQELSLALFGDTRLVRFPDMLLDPVIGARSAGHYWRSRKINALIDKDVLSNFLVESEDIRQVRVRVNGPAAAGLDHFRRWLKLSKQALTIT
jgi:putative chitinase